MHAYCNKFRAPQKPSHSLQNHKSHFVRYPSIPRILKKYYTTKKNTSYLRDPGNDKIL